MTPIETTVVVFPIIIINLTILLFFASRSKDKLDKISQLRHTYITHLSTGLSSLLKRIEKEHLAAGEIVENMNSLLDVYYDMGLFWCDYNYRCKNGILRTLALNFIILVFGWLFLLLTTFSIKNSDILLLSGSAGALILWGVYNVACGIYKVIKEGALLNEFEQRLNITING